MKKFNTLVMPICALFIVQVAHASSYTFDCEESSEGQEAICFADPGTDLYAVGDKGKRTTIQEPELIKKQKSQTQAELSRPLIFGPDQEMLSEATPALPGLPIKKSQEVATLKNMLRTQEEIRSIEIFLQPTRGPGGLGTADESGPTVSNTK